MCFWEMFKYNVYVYVFLMRFNLIKNYEKKPKKTVEYS